MHKGNTYICFDTNIYVFCALAVRESMTPNFLTSIFNEMKKEGIRLLVPEVIEHELEKVIGREVKKACEELNSIKKDIEENEILGFGLKSSLVETIKKSKDELRQLAQEIQNEILDKMHDEEFSVVIDLAQGEILRDSIRLTLKGSRPSKNSNDYGIVQPDCLIASSIKHFMISNPDCRIVFCSDNTNDFACKNGDGEFLLHPDLQDYLGPIDYCNEPKRLYQTVFTRGPENESDLEDYDSEYKRVSAASAAFDAKKLGQQFLQVKEMLSKSINADEMAISIAENAKKLSHFQNIYAKYLTEDYAKAAESALKDMILLFVLQNERAKNDSQVDDNGSDGEESENGR